MWKNIHYNNSFILIIGGITSLDELYDQVHIIAYYYGWGEDKILSLPILKRTKYVDLIIRQVKAENRTDDGDEATDIDY